MNPLEDANNKKLNRYLARLLTKLRQMEREKASGELVFTLGVSNGGINRWTVETSEGGRVSDE